jgi:cytochrome d ubiquinol oxidase subunit II
MLINAVELITFVALILYIIFGGADYGAGILELFRKNHIRNIDDEIEHTINRAIGPVWEANHIWLILIIVILFSGFPKLYVVLSTFLYIPLIAVLVGIVLRGISFTFRHYDLFEGRPEKMYTTIFSLSSLWTSVWLGIITGAIMLGRINPEADQIYSLYFYPWLNFFCFSVGLFVASVFMYLAASFLIGETNHSLMRSYFRNRAWKANIAVIASGGLVFLSAKLDGFPLMERFFHSTHSIIMMVLATLCWGIQELFTKKLPYLTRRALVVGQVVFILLGLFFVEAPTIIMTTTGALTMANTAAPEATIIQLIIALVVGLVLILPSLFFLLWIFKFKRSAT